MAYATQIAAKTEAAAANVEAVRSEALKLAAEGTYAKAWGEFGIRLAEAEGEHFAWSRLNQMVSYDPEATMEMLLGLVAQILSNGADDTWSGRGNDIARARFDGIRSVCGKVAWLS